MAFGRSNTTPPAALKPQPSLYDETVALLNRAAAERAAHEEQIAYHEQELAREQSRLATTTKIETTLQGLVG
jgi:hypothetical protein